MPSMKYMPRKQIDNRKVKRQVDKKSPMQVILLFLVALIIAAGMIFFGWIRWKQREIIYLINRTESEITATTEENKKLKAALEALRAPDRIARIAREDLGMVQPDSGDFVIIEVPSSDTGGSQ